jgi:hypothetical protein
MAKKKKPLAKRNPEAGKLQNPHFRKRVVPVKKKAKPDVGEDWE